MPTKEQFVNNYSTTIAAAASSSATMITVASAAGFPSAPSSRSGSATRSCS